MTTDEAIQQIEKLIAAGFDLDLIEPDYEALNMAVEALEAGRDRA